jgi:hypothetical protein
MNPRSADHQKAGRSASAPPPRDQLKNSPLICRCARRSSPFGGDNDHETPRLVNVNQQVHRYRDHAGVVGGNQAQRGMYPASKSTSRPAAFVRLRNGATLPTMVNTRRS